MIHLYYCACHIPHRHLEKILLCASADTISQAFAYINRYIRRIHDVYFSGINENVYLKFFFYVEFALFHTYGHISISISIVFRRVERLLLFWTYCRPTALSCLTAHIICCHNAATYLPP